MKRIRLLSFLLACAMILTSETGLAALISKQPSEMDGVSTSHAPHHMRSSSLEIHETDLTQTTPHTSYDVRLLPSDNSRAQRHSLPAVRANDSITFTQHVITDSLDGAFAVYATDIDDDGDVDILGAAYEAGEVIWWENDGSEGFFENNIASNFDYANSVFAVDMDGDDDVDILAAGAGIRWWENDGNEQFTEHTIADTSSFYQSVSATDVDGDGDIDVLAGGYIITWWENDGNENFSERIIDDVSSIHYTHTIDIDGDGDPDVIGSDKWGFYTVSWYENDGSGNFTRHYLTQSFSQPDQVYATDIDGDEDVDVIAVGGSGVHWWENNGIEDFTQHVIYSTASFSAHAVDIR